MLDFLLDYIRPVSAIFATYYVLGAVICVCVTIHDKSAAVGHKRRVSEKTLILLGVFFSAVAEYATMKIIRHKTRHKKFMIGLPAIIILKIVIVACATYALIYM